MKQIINKTAENEQIDASSSEVNRWLTNSNITLNDMINERMWGLTNNMSMNNLTATERIQLSVTNDNRMTMSMS